MALRKFAPAGSRGTFAADAAKYLKGVTSLPTYEERVKHIDLRIAEFGNRARHSIQTSDVDAVLSKWLAGGLSASTVRNRRTVLLHVWNRLDGPDLPNPVRRAIKPRLAEPEARAISYEQIGRILDAMPSAARAWQGRPETRPARRRHGWRSSPTPACHRAS